MPNPMQSFRLSPDLSARIDAWQILNGVHARGSAITSLIERGLAADASPKAQRQAKHPAAPPPSSAPADPAARAIPADTPSWMRRGFTSGAWK